MFIHEEQNYYTSYILNKTKRKSLKKNQVYWFRIQKLSKNYKKQKIYWSNFKSSYLYQFIMLFQLKQSLAIINFKIKLIDHKFKSTYYINNRLLQQIDC